jgi:hypothetical protein
MEATDLATKAAEPFLQSGTLGATVVALALALAVSWIYFLRRIERLEKGWRDDIRTSLVSVTTAVATLEKAEAFVMDRGRR